MYIERKENKNEHLYKFTVGNKSRKKSTIYILFPITQNHKVQTECCP